MLSKLQASAEGMDIGLQAGGKTLVGFARRLSQMSAAELEAHYRQMIAKQAGADGKE